MTQFVSLHVHTYFSLLDGLSSPKGLVARAKELNHPAIAITDHGVMHGAVELYRECLKEGLKPIIGTEGYIVHKDTTDHLKAFVLEGDGDYKVKGKYHQLLLAINPVGYRNLCKLTSLAHLTEGRGAKSGKSETSTKSKSWFTLEELEQYSEGLIATSGCMAGIIPQALKAGDTAYAEKMAQWYQSVFGDRFYIEIQDHGATADDGSDYLNVLLIGLADKLGIEVVATADNHYTCEKDKQAHDALLCINTGKLLSDEKRMRYEGNYWLPSGDEMVARLSRYLPTETAVRAVQNTVAIAERVEDYNLRRKPTTPLFTIPSGYVDADEYLAELTYKGLSDRLKGNVAQDYLDRVKYELGVIKDMGFSQYFLIVQDACAWSRSRDIWLGIARGSAGGCLVAYATGITNIDPMEHGLIFERFLNPGRKSMPDIDTDVCMERRPELIAYLQEKYGYDHVAQIATFNGMKSASALKDTGRVLDVKFKVANDISIGIPKTRGNPASLEKMLAKRDVYPLFYDYYQTDKKCLNDRGEAVISFREWVDLAIQLEGTIKSIGIHAAGLVMGWCPLDEIVPLMKGSNGEIVTQYCDKDLEELGLIKFDFLGLKTITVLRKTIESLNRHGEDITLDDINYNDHRVFQYMASGETEGFFQFEGYGGTLLQQIKPKNLNAVSAANTLNRPQCIDPKIDLEYIRRNSGLDRITYIHPALEEILEETLGLPIYQEQVMGICCKIAGFTLAQADDIRRGVGKKLAHVLDALEKDFLNGCERNWYDAEIGTQLWSIIKAGSDYGFNKSHSMAYGIIAYQTAYLKYYFFAHFMAALCSMERGNKIDKRVKYLIKCKSKGVTLLHPDVNQSSKDFLAVDNMTIRWGLRGIVGLGDAAIDPLILERQLAPFKDLADFYERTNLDSDAILALIKAGALDSLHPNRNELFQSIKSFKKWRAKVKKLKERIAGWEMACVQLERVDTNSLDLEEVNEHIKKVTRVTRNYQKAIETIIPTPPFPTCKDWTTKKRLEGEKEVLGLFGSGHPLDVYPVGCVPFLEAELKKVFVSTVQVNDAREANSKQGTMMYVTVEDRLGDTMTLKLFNKQFKEYGHLFRKGEHVSITAKVQEWNGRTELILNVALKPTPPSGQQQEAIVGAWEDDEF